MKFSLNAFLTGCCIVILLIIIGGTAVFFTSGANRRHSGYQYSSVPQEFRLPPQAENGSGYVELGNIRAITLPEQNADNTIIQGIPLVVNPWLSYQAQDTELYEEIITKKRPIAAAVAGYFSSLTYDEFRSLSEQQIKQELLARINQTLVLGSIDAIYFDTLIFFE